MSGSGLLSVSADFLVLRVSMTAQISGTKKDETRSQSKTASMSSEEKNKLAAQVATSGLKLDEKTKDQVARALAAEMQRRHLERESRRKDYLMASQVQLPWGKVRSSVFRWIPSLS